MRKSQENAENRKSRKILLFPLFCCPNALLTPPPLPLPHQLHTHNSPTFFFWLRSITAGRICSLRFCSPPSLISNPIFSSEPSFVSANLYTPHLKIGGSLN